MYQFTFEPVHFSDVVVASDLNKNFGGSTDLAKKRHRTEDLHTPIHSPNLQYKQSRDLKIGTRLSMRQ